MSLRRDLYRIGAVPKPVDYLFQMGAQLSPVYTLGMSAREARQIVRKPRFRTGFNDCWASPHDPIHIHEKTRSMRYTPCPAFLPSVTHSRPKSH